MSFRLDPNNPHDREILAKLKTPQGVSALDLFEKQQKPAVSSAVEKPKRAKSTLINFVESEHRNAADAEKQLFILPYPPSTNNLYVMGDDGNRHLTAVARQYKNYIRKLIVKQGARVIEGKVEIICHVFRPIRRGDLSNRIKLIEDAFKGLTWNDDEQVVHLDMWRHLSRDNPRVELTICEYKRFFA